MYSIIDLINGFSIANKYEIACAIAEDAYLSHHAALEYHGLSNQVFHVIYVSTKKRFNPFDYDGITYKYVKPQIDQGVLILSHVRVTDLERTIIDSINHINKITGLEELIKSINLIKSLDEDKIMKYLSLYNVQSLYQKTGYILEKHQKNLNLSDYFFTWCKSKIKHNITYLTDREIYQFEFNQEWQLMEPVFTYQEMDDEDSMID